MALDGELVYLREEQEADLPFLVHLRNDLDTQAWSQTLPPDYTLSMYTKRYEGREFSFNRTDGRFMIVMKEGNVPTGTISYTSLRPRWSAMIGIMIAKEFWGIGVAFDAQEILLKFLFQELGLRVVRLYTHSGNPRAVRLAERSGFRVSVRQRQSIYKSGELLDNLSMDILREEYFASHPVHADKLPPLL
jgi:RimJ/RimL family protein N-acetyltransferase